MQYCIASLDMPDAGSYDISLIGSQTGNGRKFPVKVAPLAAAPNHTTARLHDSSACELGFCAGDEVVIEVALRDEHGNATTDLGAQDLSVTSRGPATALFNRGEGIGSPVFK